MHLLDSPLMSQQGRRQSGKRAPEPGAKRAKSNGGRDPELWQVWIKVGAPVDFDRAYRRAEQLTVDALVVPAR